MSGKHWVGWMLLVGAAVMPPASAQMAQRAKASGAVLRVGAGRAYAMPSQAAQAAKDGDTVEIDGGAYPGDVAVWRADRLTIRGVGVKRPVLDAQGHAAMGKGLWVIDGRDTTVENLEFTGASVPDKNGAGLRLDGAGLTVRHCYFHDNEDGILANAAPDGDVVVENSEFSHNGQGDGYSHNTYIGHVRRFTLRGCYVHNAKMGHDVKSRAAINDIRYNRISDDDGSDTSFLIDLPNGGDCVLVGNVLRRGASASQSVLVSFAEEGAINPKQALSVVNNTFDNQRAGATFVRVAGQPALKVVNNLFVGTGTWLAGGTLDTAGNKAATAADFKNAALGDYHLTAGSAAIGAGVDPGKADGDLTPRFEYNLSIGQEQRRTKTPPDLGAYGTP